MTVELAHLKRHSKLIEMFELPIAMRGPAVIVALIIRPCKSLLVGICYSVPRPANISQYGMPVAMTMAEWMPRCVWTVASRSLC